MKRYPVVLGVTAAGLAGILSFHTHSATVAIPTRSSTSAGNASRAQAPSSSSASQGSASQGSAPQGSAPQGSAPQGSAPQGSASPTTSAKSATGSLEQYGYGQLSVRVTIAAGRITNLKIATLKTADTYSQQLALQVAPILQREVLSAQSARINGLSGATYTSEAYAYSVQSALDKLRK
jgi:uncharacterized protein with FMN-binding domain